MKIARIQVNGNDLGGKICCVFCGMVFDPMIHPKHCPRQSCGKLLRNFPPTYTDSVVPHPCRDNTGYSHALYAERYDLRGQGLSEAHEYLDKHISWDDWVVTFLVETEQQDDFAPEPNPNREFLILSGPTLDYWGQPVYAYYFQRAIRPKQEDLDQALAELKLELERAKHSRTQRFFNWLDGRKAFCLEDVPTGTKGPAWTEEVEAYYRETDTWVDAYVHERFGHDSTIWYEKSRAGLLAYVALVTKHHPRFRARIDEELRQLLVHPDAVGWWVGRQGCRIKELSEIWGERLRVVPTRTE